MGDWKRLKAKLLWVEFISEMNEATTQHAACGGHKESHYPSEGRREETEDPEDLTLQPSPERMAALHFSCQQQATTPAVAKTMPPAHPKLFPSLSAGTGFVEA